MLLFAIRLRCLLQNEGRVKVIMKQILSVLGLSLVLLGCTYSMALKSNISEDPYAHMVRYTVASDFETIRDQVADAITDRGMVINNVSHIGNMLERTRKDLGVGKHIYLHAEALEFCSAVVSRNTMEVDPHNIIFCPYVVTIYELKKNPGKIHVAYRKPTRLGDGAASTVMKQVKKLLDDIAKEGVE